jgi:hypothetical protein
MTSCGVHAIAGWIPRRRADGSWDTATLEADITAVKDELHIQEIDAQAHEVHGEEGDSADPPKLSLRGDGAEADDRMGLREEGEAPDTAPAECPVAEVRLKAPSRSFHANHIADFGRSRRKQETRTISRACSCAETQMRRKRALRKLRDQTLRRMMRGAGYLRY